MQSHETQPKQPKLPERRPRLLVVDDERTSRRMLASMLERAGYRVDTAADGLDALRQLRAHLHDVVLLDVLMPQMSGYDVCAAIKQDEQMRRCQVMLVTALDSTPDKVEGLDTGADDFVCKPVRRDEFLAKVRALIRARGLLDQLESARAELELKKTLAQTLVNDLRNPLAGLLGNFDLIEMGRRKDLPKLLDRSRRAAHRMLRMVSNLVEVEAMESGRATPTTERVDLAALTQQTLDELEPLARSRGVTLCCDGLMTTRISGDRQMLHRLIDNLIANAVAQSPDGGTVRVGLRPGRQGAEWTVEDDASPIPESLRHRVFDKYAEAELQQSGVMANRGLSLTLCKMVAEMHRGSIELDEAQPGKMRYRVQLRGLAPATAERPMHQAAGA